MEPLVYLKSHLESLSEGLKTADKATSLDPFTKDLIKRADSLIDRLNDPLVVWGKETDPMLIDQLGKFRQRLKDLKHFSGALPNEVLYERSLLLKVILDIESDFIHTENLSFSSNVETNSPRTSGLLQQLEVRQNELQDAFTQSLQSIDDKTGDVERFIGRIEKRSIQNLRKEAAELTELHSERLGQQVKDSLKELEDSSNSANLRLRLDVKKATDDLVKAHKEEYDNLYAELNTQTQKQIQHSDEARFEFEQKIADLNRVFEEHVNDLNSKFEAEQQAFRESLVSSIKDEVSNYQTARSLLKEQLQEAKDIVGILSKKAMAHEHLQQARRENFAYWGFQILGLSFLFLAILMSVAMFGDSLGLRLPWLTWLVEFTSTNGAIELTDATLKGVSNSTNHNSETVWFFKRISIVILLTAPGLYLLKEAANHRNKENLYRQRGVQLASITPYLKELDEKDRNAIKKDLVKSFFSFHDGKADTQNVPDFLRDLKETTKIIRTIDRATQPTSNNRSVVKRRRRQPQAVKG